MKITVEIDGKETVYDNVSDYFLAVREMKPVQNPDGGMAILPSMRSVSHGDIREILKEIRQATYELEHMKEERDGDGS